MQKFNKKICYITSRFPPLQTETYTVREVQALEHMGMDVTIFSRENMTGRQDAYSSPNVSAPIINLPERSVIDDSTLLDAIDLHSPEKLLAVLQSDPKLKECAESLVSAFAQYHQLPSYKKARSQLTSNMAMPQSTLNQGQHVLMFLQGLCVAKYMEENHISVAYAQSFSRPAQIADYASLIAKKRIPWVTAGHNTDTVILNDDEIRYRFAHADGITAEAEVARNAFSRAGVDVSKVPVIFRGIDTDVFSPAAVKLPNKRLELVSVSRAIEKKGLAFLLQALALIPDEIPIHVTYIGDGPLFEELKVQAATLGVSSKISFIGHLSSQEKIVPYLQQADAFVSSCIGIDDGVAMDHADGPKKEATDGLPTVILEAASTGLPVITTNIGGAKEVIEEGYNGYVVEERNPQQLVNAICDLARNPDKRNQMSQNARGKVVENFDYRTSQQPLIKMFENITKYKSSRYHQRDPQEKAAWCIAT